MNHWLNQAALQLRQHINQFVVLSDKEWGKLEPQRSIVQLKKHQFMATQGVVADQIGFVLEGVFRQFFTKDGQERTSYFFFDQQLIAAYMSCVTARPSSVNIEALSDATCLVLLYSVLKALLSQYTGWQEFGRLLAE